MHHMSNKIVWKMTEIWMTEETPHRDPQLISYQEN